MGGSLAAAACRGSVTRRLPVLMKVLGVLEFMPFTGQSHHRHRHHQHRKKFHRAALIAAPATKHNPQAQPAGTDILYGWGG